MNINFLKMIERLKQSARDLNGLASEDATDEFIQYEYQIKFNEINKIISILVNMLNQPKKEKESLQLLNE